MRKSSIRLIKIPEGDNRKSGEKIVFKKTIAENFQNVLQGTHFHTLEALLRICCYSWVGGLVSWKDAWHRHFLVCRKLQKKKKKRKGYYSYPNKKKRKVEPTTYQRAEVTRQPSNLKSRKKLVPPRNKETHELSRFWQSPGRRGAALLNHK